MVGVLYCRDTGRLKYIVLSLQLVRLNTKFMILLFDMDKNIGYYSKTLAGLKDITGRSTQTMRNWLKKPENSLKQGFLIVEGIKKLSKQGGKRVK